VLGDQLALVLRTASAIVDDPGILVIGSQSVLGSYDGAVLPLAATASMEVDLAYFDDPEDAKADRVDAAIGELSEFHERNGFYAQGVSVGTAVLPDGWRERVVSWSDGGATAAFLEPHDCVISKLVAYREKDTAFAAALLDAGLVGTAVLRERVEQLPRATDPRVLRMLHEWLDWYETRPRF
jgi:hypothetical protein